jgi:hypothetical protein
MCPWLGNDVGLLSGPLSFVVDTVTGVNHPEVLDALRTRCPLVEAVPSDFLETNLGARMFNKIFVYGVVQNVSDEDVVCAFIEKAFKHLHPGGRIPVGDLSNIDKRARFQATTFG